MTTMERIGSVWGGLSYCRVSSVMCQRATANSTPRKSRSPELSSRVGRISSHGSAGSSLKIWMEWKRCPSLSASFQNACLKGAGANCW